MHHRWDAVHRLKDAMDRRVDAGDRHGEPGWERAIAARLREGLPVSDARLDRVFGPGLQRLSALHFTPLAVAVRAAAWLTAGGAREVCDLGAGAGKFCLVGAATTLARFTGIEIRPALVEVAQRAARRLGLPRAQFVLGDLRTAPLRRYQAFHVYDPFAEAAVDPDERLGPQVPTSDRSADVGRLLDRLEESPARTRLTLFCDLGGRTPRGWRLVDRLPLDGRGGLIDCWERLAAGRPRAGARPPGAARTGRRGAPRPGSGRPPAGRA
jgi:hypothetical protein